MSTSQISRGSYIGSAGRVSVATAFSRVLGLVREQVMAYYFGAGMATDAFVTAFRIPNLLRDMFAEGALSSAFVPVFKDKLVSQSEQAAFRLARIVVTALLLAVGFIVILGVIAAPLLVYVSAHGFMAVPEKFHLTVSLTRVMFVYLLLVSVAALVMGMLNSFGRFGIPALSPAMFNVGTVVTVIVLYEYFDQPVYTLALGVVFGGVGQLAIQLPSLWRIGFRFRLCFDFLDEGLKRVVRLLMPMIVGLSGGRINILVSTLLASFLMEGSISFLNYSYRLMHFPLGVFAVALGTVALPRVSEMVARKEHNKLSDTYMETLGLNLGVVVPSAVFLALMAHEIIDLIYHWGAFSQADVHHTATALRHYAYGLIGFAAVRVTAPFYYAFEDSRLPMRLSLISVGVNLLLYYPMIKVFDFAGLAAATSLAGILNFLLLLFYLPSKGIHVPLGRLTLLAFRMCVAALLAFSVARLVPWPSIWSDLTIVNRLVNLIVPSVIGGALYVIICLVLRVPLPGLSRRTVS